MSLDLDQNGARENSPGYGFDASESVLKRSIRKLKSEVAPAVTNSMIGISLGLLEAGILQDILDNYATTSRGDLLKDVIWAGLVGVFLVDRVLRFVGNVETFSESIQNIISEVNKK